MIDQLRQEIQKHLDEVLGEAHRLRSALAALGGHDSAARAGTASPAPRATAGSRSRNGRGAGTAARSRRSTGSPVSARARARSNGTTDGRGRSTPGGTKSAVLAALATGNAMTASEVAAATNLGRASVSTTLSKLSKAGDVAKAERGYRLAK
jgi:DNA-binding transcriptional ArsR family regulator